MQHFQSILIVIGIIAIAGVLIHGYFSARKEKEQDTETESVPETPDMFAAALSTPVETGMEESADVQVLRHNSDLPASETIDFSQALNNEKVEPIEFNELDLDTSLDVDAVQKDEQVVPEVTIAQDEAPQESEVLSPEELEPVISSADNEEKVVQPTDLFIFNVSAQEGKQLGGHELLQFFLTSGFRFGEMSIFHRHQHSDGTGPVLFSIANMMAPGVFDPDTMEQFKSEGVSFFLTAPNENIDIKSSFDMMLRAVEQMAEEFDCVVLNADREMMTEAQFLDYRNRLLHYI